MIPEHFYMTDLGKMVYVAVYLPLVLGLFWWLYRKFKPTWPFLAVLALVLLTLPFWDVYMIGRDAERLCKEQGGLHVYKTEEAEGFWGGGGVEYWLSYGFRYVESGGGKMMSRYSMQDGKAVHQRVQEIISRYSATSGDNHVVINKSISRSSEKTINLKTNEVLGELVVFNVYPGRFDGIFLRLAGSGPVVWHCGDTSSTGEKLNYRDLVKATIKPVRSGGAQ